MSKSRCGARISPAWEKQPAVLTLYARGLGHKRIAGMLAISPRIARQIIIASGTWTPADKHNGIERRGEGPHSKLRFAAQKPVRVMRQRLDRARAALNRAHDNQQRRLAKEASRCAPAGMTDAETWAWRYRNDSAFKLKALMRSRMKKIIGGLHASRRQIALLGCSVEQFKHHIEQQFKPGMTWQNNGNGKGKWQLDHILPCAAFDQEDEAQRRQCWHYTNFQPLWSRQNIRKYSVVNHTNAQMSLLM